MAALTAHVAPIGGVAFGDVTFSAAVAWKLRTGGMWHEYDVEWREAVYVASDGEWVNCFTVSEVTSEEAAAILAECGPPVWDEPRFRSAVERVLGAPAHSLQ